MGATGPISRTTMNIDDVPTILVIGKHPDYTELENELEKLGVDVESAHSDLIIDAVIAAAPDLVLLAGEAAKQNGKEISKKLSENPAGAVVPIVVLGDRTYEESSKAFRHGIVSIIDRNTQVEKIAEHVVSIVAELPERPGECRGIVGEATLDELVGLLSSELRSGVLSVRSKSKDKNIQGARIVLRAGHAISEEVDSFVNRIKPIIAENEELSYKFEENSCGRVDSVRPPSIDGAFSVATLHGRRILIVGRDRLQADRLAKALRGQQALAVTLCEIEVDLERARALDPEVIIIDSGDINNECAATIETLRQDLRMRWASILMSSKDQVWPEGTSVPRIDFLTKKIIALNKPDLELRRRAQISRRFDTRLEIIGPSRMLRVLAETGRMLRISLKHSRANIQIEVADGLISGAKGILKEKSSIPISGTTALAVFMALASGRVNIEELSTVQLSDLESPVDLMLSLAAEEALPITPSIPPQSIIPNPVKPSPMVHSAVNELLPKNSSVNIPQQSRSISNVNTKIVKDRPLEPPQGLDNSPPKSNWWLDQAVPSTGSSLGQRKQKGFEGAECATQEVLIHNDLAAKLKSKRDSTQQEIQREETISSSDDVVDIDVAIDEAKTPARWNRYVHILTRLEVFLSSFKDRHKYLFHICFRLFTTQGFTRIANSTKRLGGISVGYMYRTFSALKGILPLLRFGKLSSQTSHILGRFGQKFDLIFLRNLFLSAKQRILCLSRKTKIISASSLILLGTVPTLSFLILDNRNSHSLAQGENQLVHVANKVSIQNKKKGLPLSTSSVSNPHNGTESKRSITDLNSTIRGSNTTKKDVAGIQPQSLSEGLDNAEFDLSHDLAEGIDETDDSIEVDEEKPKEFTENEINYSKRERQRRISKANKLLIKGNSYRRRGRLGMAESYYLQSLKIYPRYPRALVGLVKVHLKRRASREALRWAKQLVRRKPKPSLYHLLLGDAYALDGALTKARSEWKIARRRGNATAGRRLRSQD